MTTKAQRASQVNRGLDPNMSSQRDQMLFELEQRLAQVGRRLSAEEASSLIAEDFVEFGSSGKVWSKAEIIAAMSQWTNP
jgi:hypothetical protein